MSKKKNQVIPNGVPRGYKVQTGIACCVNCEFGGYLGTVDDDVDRRCFCEILGEPDDVANSVWVEPLGKCDAHKWGK